MLVSEQKSWITEKKVEGNEMRKKLNERTVHVYTEINVE